jgi:hypothetical protein
MSAPHVEHLSLTLELEDGDYADDRATWQDLADALSSLRYPDLLDFDLCLKIPVDRWRNIEIAVRGPELAHDLVLIVSVADCGYRRESENFSRP